MNLKYKLRKIYWLLSAKYIAWKNPIDNSLTYFGITGTDGKTTTSSFLYEIAKANGYRPLILTTVSAKFDDKTIDANLKSTSFLSYSAKNIISGIIRLDLKKFFKNLLFLDREGFEEQKEQHRTTPLAGEIRRLINEYTAKGANFFILETTSHGLDQYRVYGIKYDAVIYTNITREHLDYHGSWQNYASAKATLISQLKDNGIVAINKDDKDSYDFLSTIIKKSKKNISKVEYSVEDRENIDLKNFFIKAKRENEIIFLKAEKNKSKDAYPTSINLFGNYNVSNALAAVSGFYGFNVGTSRDLSLQQIASALPNLKEVSGRMEFLSKNPTVIVDFAHTPNAMLQALESTKALVNKRGKLWVIFGCAGLRDNFKRPTMGKIAFENADNILITSEDPRTEDLSQINDQIISGFKDEKYVLEKYSSKSKYTPQNSKYVVRFDEPNLNSRRDAITFAIRNAEKEDTVIILGKGHETSLCFGTKEYEWNDIEEVKRIKSQETNR